MSWRIGLGLKKDSFDWSFEVDEIDKIPDTFFNKLWGYRPLKIIFLRGQEDKFFNFLERMIEIGLDVRDIWAIYRRDKDLTIKEGDFIEHADFDAIKEFFG